MNRSTSGIGSSSTIPSLERKIVRRYATDILEVLTVASPVGTQPFETLVRHPKFKNVNPIVVAAYDTQQEAEAGHAQWLETMQGDTLPKELDDIGNWGSLQSSGVGGQQRLAASFPQRGAASRPSREPKEDTDDDE